MNFDLKIFVFGRPDLSENNAKHGIQFEGQEVGQINFQRSNSNMGLMAAR